MDAMIDGLTKGVEGEAGGGGPIGEWALEVLPEAFDGIEFGAVGRKGDQDDVSRWGEGASDVGRGVVEHQEMEVVGFLLAELL